MNYDMEWREYKQMYTFILKMETRNCDIYRSTEYGSNIGHHAKPFHLHYRVCHNNTHVSMISWIKEHHKREKSPISALNLKNPGPITSLLQSYIASTTCHQNFNYVTHRNQTDSVPYITLLHQILPGHSSKIGEPFSYHCHQ